MNSVCSSVRPTARLRRAKAFLWVYAYQGLTAAIIALPLAKLLGGVLANFPKGDALAIEPGSMFLRESLGQTPLTEIGPVIITAVTWWLLLALGAQFPAVHWLFTLLPTTSRTGSWKDYTHAVVQFVGLGLVAGVTRCLLWGFAYTSGLTLVTLLQHNPDQRLIDLISWLPLAIMIPVTVGVSALEGLTRLGIVSHKVNQKAHTAEPKNNLLGPPTVGDAFAMALIVAKRHWAATVGTYLAYRGLGLLAIILGALAVDAVQVQKGGLWRTGLCLAIHQVVVLGTLVLHAAWQQSCMPRVQRTTRPFSH